MDPKDKNGVVFLSPPADPAPEIHTEYYEQRFFFKTLKNLQQ
jgi:hypothetical protein